MHLQFLWFLEFSSSFLLAPCLPWIQQTVHTVRHSETTGVTNGQQCRVPLAVLILAPDQT